MSNDLLHADGLGENDVCTDVIIILGVWDENVLHSNVKGSVLSDDLNKTVAILPYDTEVMGQICSLSIVREEAVYNVEKLDIPEQNNFEKIISADQKYKDTIFRRLFKEKSEALSLYNALNDTKYADPNELEIVTLENAIYMNVKNDLAFLLDSTLNMYEHQSTYAPNMPLRNLIYVTSEYQKLVDKHSLFSERPIKIPTPRFVVFYNGMETRPEREILKLSDLYEVPSANPELELQVLVLNINDGYNEELKAQCKTLREYMIYVDKVRYYQNQKKLSLKKAVDKAIQECLKEGILTEFLRKNRSEIVGISIFEYDEELLKKDQFEYGMECGIKQGIERGIQFALIGLVKKGVLTITDAAEEANMSTDDFEKLLE